VVVGDKVCGPEGMREKADHYWVVDDADDSDSASAEIVEGSKNGQANREGAPVICFLFFFFFFFFSTTMLRCPTHDTVTVQEAKLSSGHLERRSSYAGYSRKGAVGSAGNHLSVHRRLARIGAKGRQSPRRRFDPPARLARRCRHRRVTAKYLPSMFPMAYPSAPVTAPGGRSAT